MKLRSGAVLNYEDVNVIVKPVVTDGSNNKKIPLTREDAANVLLSIKNSSTDSNKDLSDLSKFRLVYHPDKPTETSIKRIRELMSIITNMTGSGDKYMLNKMKAIISLYTYFNMNIENILVKNCFTYNTMNMIFSMKTAAYRLMEECKNKNGKKERFNHSSTLLCTLEHLNDVLYCSYNLLNRLVDKYELHSKMKNYVVI